MSFTYETAGNNVLQQAGFYSAEASDATLARIYYWIDEGVLEFQKAHRNYYYKNIAYRRATDSAALSGSISGAVGSHTATITYTGNWQDLVGATIVKTESGSTYRNIIRTVTNTSTKACELLLPSRFTNGTIAIYCRSCYLSTATWIAPRSRFLKYGSFFLDENDCAYPLHLLEQPTFFSSGDLFEPTDVYPTYFCVVQDLPILDVFWPLDSGWSVSFAVERRPASYSKPADTVDIPDEFEKAVERYALGRFLMHHDENKGQGSFELRSSIEMLTRKGGIS